MTPKRPRALLTFLTAVKRQSQHSPWSCQCIRIGTLATSKNKACVTHVWNSSSRISVLTAQVNKKLEKWSQYWTIIYIYLLFSRDPACFSSGTSSNWEFAEKRVTQDQSIPASVDFIHGESWLTTLQFNHGYPVILRMLGFFSSSFSGKIQHPWLLSSPNVTG